LPEEKLTYKVQLDEEDLGNQLDQIRSRIDEVLGTSALQTPGFDMPNLVASVGTMPTTFDFTPPADFARQLDTGFWQSQLSNMGDVLNRAQMGYRNFVGDMRQFGVIGPPALTSDLADMSQTSPGTLASLKATLLSARSAGWDPRGPVSPGEFRRMSSENIFQGTSEFLTDNMFTTIGSAGGWIGTGIGMGLDFTANLLTKDVRERENLARGLVDLADQNRFDLSRQDARGISTQIYDTVRSDIGRARGYSVEEIEENIVGFEAAGGFKGIRSADQLSETIRGVVENTRTVQQDLNVFADEAVNIMGQLQNKMLVTSENINVLTAEAKSIGEQTGLAPIDVINIGVAGAQSVRGTGIGPGAGYQLAVDARLQAERLAQSDDAFTRSLIADYGGPGAAGQTLMQDNLRWMMGNQGTMALAGMLGGASPGTSLQGMLSTAGGILSNPAMMLAASAQMPRMIGGMTGEEQLFTRMGAAISTLRSLPGTVTGPGGTIKADVLAGFLVQNQGMRPQDAWLSVRSFYDAAERDPGEQWANTAFTMAQSMSDAGEVSRWDRIKASLTSDVRIPGMEGFGLLRLETAKDISIGLQNLWNDDTYRFGGFGQESIDSRLGEAMTNFRQTQTFKDVSDAVRGSDTAYRSEAINREWNEFQNRFIPVTHFGASTNIFTRDYTDVFKENSWGYSIDAKIELSEKVASWQEDGIKAGQAGKWLDNYNKFEVGYVDTSGDFQDIVIDAHESITSSNIVNNLSSKTSGEVMNELAKITTGKNKFSDLNPTEVTAVKKAIDNMPQITNKVTGGLNPGEFGPRDTFLSRRAAGISKSLEQNEQTIRGILTAPISQARRDRAINQILTEAPAGSITRQEAGAQLDEAISATQDRFLEGFNKRTDSLDAETFKEARRRAFAEKDKEIGFFSGLFGTSRADKVAEYYGVVSAIDEIAAGIETEGLDATSTVAGLRILQATPKMRDMWAPFEGITDDEQRIQIENAIWDRTVKAMVTEGEIKFGRKLTTEETSKLASQLSESFETVSGRSRKMAELIDKMAPFEMQEFFKEFPALRKDFEDAADPEEYMRAIMKSLIEGNALRVTLVDSMGYKPTVNANQNLKTFKY